MTFSILASTLKFVTRLGRVPGALSMTRTACSVPQSVTASAYADLWTGWTEKQDDSQIDEANKNMCETQIILK
jgi:hypothetical protein